MYKSFSILISSLLIFFGCVLINIDYRSILYKEQNYNNINLELKQLLVPYKDIIQNTSDSFGINPITIFGIIAAENTLNNNRFKYLEGDIIKYMVSNNSDEYLLNLLLENDTMNSNTNQFYYKLTNKLSWTLGVCQISINRAVHLEKIMCKHDRREQRSISGIILSLLDPVENIKYCALELKLINTYYESVLHINISNDPGLLSTAYNIGLDRVKEKYKRNSNAKPKSNNFGNFITDHLNCFIIINKLDDSGNNQTPDCEKSTIDLVDEKYFPTSIMIPFFSIQ